MFPEIFNFHKIFPEMFTEMFLKCNLILARIGFFLFHPEKFNVDSVKTKLSDPCQTTRLRGYLTQNQVAPDYSSAVLIYFRNQR
jgi:hypothetical protein